MCSKRHSDKHSDTVKVCLDCAEKKIDTAVIPIEKDGFCAYELFNKSCLSEQSNGDDLRLVAVQNILTNKLGLGQNLAEGEAAGLMAGAHGGQIAMKALADELNVCVLLEVICAALWDKESKKKGTVPSCLSIYI
jgi:hypothetical protein